MAFCYFYDYDFFKSRPFLKEVAEAFQDIADGKIKTLAVSLPPRAGKSYVTTLFCAWILGRYPEDSVMRNTCTARLAEKLSYDARDVVRSEKFALVFPDVRLSDDRAGVSGWNTNKSKNVGYFGQGVGGTIIGFGATKCAITDDLFRNMEDALSETIREKVHSWKEATHDSRKETGCAEIDIGTRWTIDDVIGLNSAGGYYDREIIIPALDENGLSFCEAVMSTEEYLRKKEKTRAEIWSAEYMQQPVDIKGRLFDDLKEFNDLAAVLKNSEGSISYVDVADEGSDYLCALVGHVVADLVYITEVLYTKANTDNTIPRLAEMLKRNKTRYARVETNGMGALFIKMLRPLVPDTDVMGVTNRAHKETRILMNSGYLQRRFRFLPAESGEYYAFIQALRSYQKEGKNKNDDAPDAGTGLAVMARSFFPHLDE